MYPKYRIYIDEVGNSDLGSSDKPNHRFLSLTGVIFELDYVRNVIHHEIEHFKAKYFNSHPDEPVILHRKEIINKKYPFHILKDPNMEKAFNSDLLFLLKKWEYTVISVLIDKREHRNRYSVWRYDPYHYCLAIILERYYRFLTDNKFIGDVMVESRGGNEDKRLKKSYQRIFNEGTNYIRPENLHQIFSSCQLKVKPKALNISGLQIADLLAYPARKYMFKFYKIIDDHRITFNEQIIEILKQKFFNRGNKTEGYGIKLLP